MRGRPRHPDILTPGEWRVLDEVRAGRTNAEIAERLGLSANTVKYHVANILSKLHLESREEVRDWSGQRGTLSGRFGGLKWPVALVGSAAAVVAAGILTTGQFGGRPSAEEEANRYKIAFIGGDDAKRPLRLIDSRDGREWVAGEFQPQPPYSLSWSPDRKSIALLWNAATPNCPVSGASCPAPMPDERLLVLDLDTGELDERAKGIGSNQGSIGWRDGEVLIQTALNDAQGGPGARLYNLDSVSCSDISFRGGVAVCLWWNPTNNTEQEIRVGDVDVGFGDAALVSRIRPEGHSAWARLSHDGRWVAWNRTDLDRYQLALSHVPAVGQVESETRALGVCSEPHWSPTEPLLACVRQPERDGREFSVVVHHAEDGRTQVIGTWTGVREVTWSPDGKHLAFVAQSDNETGEIYVIEVDGSRLRRLTFNDTPEFEIAWASE